MGHMPKPRIGKPRRSAVHYLVLAINMVLITAALASASLLYWANDQASAVKRVTLDESLVDVSDIPKGERVMNILLVGSDSSANLSQSDPIRNGRDGQQLGDVIIIAHIDERTSEVAMLSLPRDLWVTIPGIGRSHRINKAFESGGPKMLVETIEENFKIPIHHYVNVDFAGFQGIVEAVDSVDIYFPRPARDFNDLADPPRTQTGFSMPNAGCQVLYPKNALAYVRSRYYQTQNSDGEWVTDPSSDLGRISRQQDFLRQLMKRSIELGARNPLVLNNLVSEGLAHVTIDASLKPQLALDLAQNFSNFEPDSLQTYAMPNVDAREGSRQVLRIDDKSAAPLLSLFQGAGFRDPSTVNAMVYVDKEPGEVLTANLALALEGVGFRTTEFATSDFSRPSDVDYVVRHGTDGKAAADLVVASLSGTVRVQQTRHLSGRDVQIVPAKGATETAQARAATTTLPRATTTTTPTTPSTQVTDSAISTTITEPVNEVAAAPAGAIVVEDNSRAYRSSVCN